MDIEQHLTSDFEEAAYLVDLSNVVRMRKIGEAGQRSLRRLALVVDAAVALSQDPQVRLYLVADSSLRHTNRRDFSDPADQRMLTRWVNRGLVEELGDADDRILEIWDMTGIPVISGDRYRDARTAYPLLQGNTTDFFEPTPRPNGTVTLVPVDMGVATALEISRKEEESVLKKQGLLGARRAPRTDVVRRNWRCPDSRCTLYDTTKGTAVLLPRMRKGKPTCELHGQTLLDDGPRTAVAQVKLLVDGTCAARFTLEDDATVNIGRAPGDKGISLHGVLSPERIARISRIHLELSIADGVVSVEDRSSYGTRRRVGGGRDRWHMLSDKGRVRFNAGDELELSEGIVLARSGRRFPTELAQDWQRRVPPAVEAQAETRMF